jgi:hypothetical protein
MQYTFRARARNGNSIETADGPTVSAYTQCTLTYNAGVNGSISGTTPQYVNYGGNGTQVTAVPNTGYSFVQWSDGVLTADALTPMSPTNKTVTAQFADQNRPTSSLNAAG